jgi:hypothetical protein
VLAKPLVLFMPICFPVPYFPINDSSTH